jgi:hypothetical protein
MRFLAAALVLSLGLIGCGDDDNTTAPPYLDQELADEIAQHVGMTLAAGTGGSMLSLTATAATIPSGLVGQDGARPARDTLFSASGVAWSVVDTFFTAGDTPQEDYDALTTRVSVHAQGAGDIVRTTAPAFRATLRHRAHLQGSGLSATTDSVMLAGSAHDSTRSTFTAKFTGATCRLLCTSTIAHSSIGTTKGQSPFTSPFSGVSAWTMAVTRYSNSDTTQVNRTATTDVLVGFDGTSHAILEVGGLYSYQVDLATGEIARYGAPLAARH